MDGTTVLIRPFFRWYDLWVGAYWDRANRTLYVCPLPMIGVKVVVSAAPPLRPMPKDKE